MSGPYSLRTECCRYQVFCSACAKVGVRWGRVALWLPLGLCRGPAPNPIPFQGSAATNCGEAGGSIRLHCVRYPHVPTGVWCGTYDTAGRSELPGIDTLQRWLASDTAPQPALYVVCLQNCRPGGAKLWGLQLLSSLNSRSFRLLSSTVSGTLALLIFIAQSCDVHCSQVQAFPAQAKAQTSIFVGLKLHDTYIGFLGSNVQQTAADTPDQLAGLLEVVLQAPRYGSHRLPIIHQVDFLFWLGSFASRIPASGTEAAHALLQRGDYERLVTLLDPLRNLKTQKRV